MGWGAEWRSLSISVQDKPAFAALEEIGGEEKVVFMQEWLCVCSCSVHVAHVRAVGVH